MQSARVFRASDSSKFPKYIVIGVIVVIILIIALSSIFFSRPQSNLPHYDIIGFVVVPWKITPSLAYLLEKLDRQWKKSDSRTKASTRLFFFTYDSAQDSSTLSRFDNLVVLPNLNHMKPLRSVLGMESEKHHPCSVEENDLETHLQYYAINYLTKKYSFRLLAKLTESTYFRVDHFMNSVVTKSHFERSVHASFEGPNPCMNIADGNQFKYPSSVGYIFSRDIAEYVSNLNPELIFLQSHPNVMFGFYLVPLELTIRHDIRFHDTKSGSEQASNNENSPKCHYKNIIMHTMKSEWWDDIDEKGILPCDMDHNPGNLCHSENCITQNDPTDFSMFQWSKDRKYKKMRYNFDLVNPKDL